MSLHIAVLCCAVSCLQAGTKGMLEPTAVHQRSWEVLAEALEHRGSTRWHLAPVHQVLLKAPCRLGLMTPPLVSMRRQQGFV
jgi:hypothetical protein